MYQSFSERGQLIPSKINFDSGKCDVTQITVQIDSVILVESKTLLLQTRATPGNILLHKQRKIK